MNPVSSAQNYQTVSDYPELSASIDSTNKKSKGKRNRRGRSVGTVEPKNTYQQKSVVDAHSASITNKKKIGHCKVSALFSDEGTSDSLKLIVDEKSAILQNKQRELESILKQFFYTCHGMSFSASEQDANIQGFIKAVEEYIDENQKVINIFDSKTIIKNIIISIDGKYTPFSEYKHKKFPLLISNQAIFLSVLYIDHSKKISSIIKDDFACIENIKMFREGERCSLLVYIAWLNIINESMTIGYQVTDLMKGNDTLVSIELIKNNNVSKLFSVTMLNTMNLMAYVAKAVIDISISENKNDNADDVNYLVKKFFDLINDNNDIKNNIIRWGVECINNLTTKGYDSDFNCFFSLIHLLKLCLLIDAFTLAENIVACLGSLRSLLVYFKNPCSIYDFIFSYNIKWMADNRGFENKTYSECWSIVANVARRNDILETILAVIPLSETQRESIDSQNIAMATFKDDLLARVNNLFDTIDVMSAKEQLGIAEKYTAEQAEKQRTEQIKQAAVAKQFLARQHEVSNENSNEVSIAQALPAIEPHMEKIAQASRTYMDGSNISKACEILKSLLLDTSLSGTDLVEVHYAKADLLLAEISRRCDNVINKSNSIAIFRDDVNRCIGTQHKVGKVNFDKLVSKDFMKAIKSFENMPSLISGLLEKFNTALQAFIQQKDRTKFSEQDQASFAALHAKAEKIKSACQNAVRLMDDALSLYKQRGELIRTLEPSHAKPVSKVIPFDKQAFEDSVSQLSQSCEEWDLSSLLALATSSVQQVAWADQQAADSQVVDNSVTIT